MAAGKLLGLDCCTWATVLMEAVGGAAGGSRVKNFAAKELGKFDSTKLTNWGVSSRTTDVDAVDVLKPYQLPKIKVLFLIIGPPAVKPYSLRRVGGMLVWNMVREVSTLSVKNSESVP